MQETLSVPKYKEGQALMKRKAKKGKKGGKSSKSKSKPKAADVADVSDTKNLLGVGGDASPTSSDDPTGGLLGGITGEVMKAVGKMQEVIITWYVPASRPSAIWDVVNGRELKIDFDSYSARLRLLRYTGHDLLNPSCWANGDWAPTVRLPPSTDRCSVSSSATQSDPLSHTLSSTAPKQDQSFACALTMEGWEDRPACFKFLERTSCPHQSHLPLTFSPTSLPSQPKTDHLIRPSQSATAPPNASLSASSTPAPAVPSGPSTSISPRRPSPPSRISTRGN